MVLTCLGKAAGTFHECITILNHLDAGNAYFEIAKLDRIHFVLSAGISWPSMKAAECPLIGSHFGLWR